MTYMEPVPIHERVDKRGCLLIMHRSQHSLQCLTLTLGLICSRPIRTTFIAHVSMKRPPIETAWEIGSILFVILNFFKWMFVKDTWTYICILFLK